MTITYRTRKEGLECIVCPHQCMIPEGKTGICGVRKNSGGKIELLTYGVLSGLALDPIEKKPLYHFFPGSNILSAGSWGCNMKCDFCQNYHISQEIYVNQADRISPGQLLGEVRRAPGNIGIAFTYNEPVIWYEFIKDTASEVKKEGYFTVMVTNGFVSEEILKEYLGFIDAFNVDLKAFNNDFYRKVAKAKLDPVKKTLKMIAESGKHLEITTLVIPGLNDSKAEMDKEAGWISDELGRDVPFHLSRYFPKYRRTDPATPYGTLKELYETAARHLSYVYMGNTALDAGLSTICPECGTVITRRTGYTIEQLNTSDGKCSGCGKEIYRHFISSSSI